jgi:hypothetical protein
MKKIAAIIALTVCGAAHASTQWTLQEKTYDVDTLFHAVVGPGTTQTSLQLSGAQNLRVFYTTTKLANPYVEMRVTKASNKLTGVDKLSSMAKAHTTSDERYFAGVNADFFGNSRPIGSTVVDRHVYYAVNSGWTNWYMTADKNTAIENLTFSGTATNPAGASHAISGVNIGRSENYLVIYNKYVGANTATNSYGSEVKIVPMDGELPFKGTVRFKVSGAVATAGSMAIDDDACVLSGHGTAATFVNTLNDGDIVTFDLNTAMSVSSSDITQMAGGQPMILKDGVTLDTQTALDHLTALNPRTAVGYNADRSELVLLVVDGRSSISAGVVSRVLADMMREVGCSDAMNFDGGGSSELYNIDLGVANQPSDGNERSVTNAVWAVAVAPADDQVAEIRFVDWAMTLPKYGYYVPQIYGYNKYGVLIDTDLKGVTLSCDDALGRVVGDGSTLFANGDGCHALTATYGSATATIAVTIGGGEPRMRLSDVIVDSFHDYSAEVIATVLEKDMSIDNSALSWSSDDSAIATVDDAGLIHGVADGATTVRAKVENYDLALNVNVQIPKRRWIDIDEKATADNWTTSKVALKEITLSAIDDKTLAVDYTVSSTRGTAFTLKRSASMTSIPDSIRLVVNPGDAKITKIEVNAGPVGDRATKVTLTPTLTAGEANVITIPVSDFCDANDFASYPFEFTSMVFYLGDSSSTTHRVTINAIQGVYTSLDPSTNGVKDITIATKDNILNISRVHQGEPFILGEASKWSVTSLGGVILATGDGQAIPTDKLPVGVVIISTPGGAQSAIITK